MLYFPPFAHDPNVPKEPILLHFVRLPWGPLRLLVSYGRRYCSSFGSSVRMVGFSLVSSAKYQSSGVTALLRTSNTSRHESPVSIFEDANGFSGKQGYQDRSQHNQPCHKVQAPEVSCCALEAPTNTNQLSKH